LPGYPRFPPPTAPCGFIPQERKCALGYARADQPWSPVRQAHRGTGREGRSGVSWSTFVSGVTSTPGDSCRRRHICTRCLDTRCGCPVHSGRGDRRRERCTIEAGRLLSMYEGHHSECLHRRCGSATVHPCPKRPQTTTTHAAVRARKRLCVRKSSGFPA